MKVNVICDKCGKEFKAEISDEAKGYDYHTHVVDKPVCEYTPGKKCKTTSKGTYEGQVKCPHCGAPLHVEFMTKEEEPKKCDSWVCLWKSSETPVYRTLR
jgi:transcription elongation factor Elf1